MHRNQEKRNSTRKIISHSAAVATRNQHRGDPAAQYALFDSTEPRACFDVMLLGAFSVCMCVLEMQGWHDVISYFKPRMAYIHTAQ